MGRAAGRPAAVATAGAAEGRALDLLGRARRMLKGGGPGEAATPQYYNVPCPAGHVIRGLRTEGYQAIRCPTCGEGIFVLPRSPLPDPPAPSTLRARRRRPPPPPVDEPIILTDAPPQEAVEEVIWLDPDPAEMAAAEAAAARERGPSAPSDEQIPPEYREPVEARAPTAGGGDGARTSDQPAAPATRPRRTPRRPERSPADGAVSRPPRTILVPERPRPASWARRHRLGLLLVGVVSLVGMTVGYRVWLQRWENLPRLAESNWIEGQEALEAGEFDEAKQKLSRAAQAFARLGIQDERATRSRQLAGEAAILADRCRLQLEELMEEAARYSPSEEWPSRFATIYKGQAVVFDTTVVATPEQSRRGSYEIDYRVFSGRGPLPSREGRIDLKGFRLFETLRPRVGEAKVFGARLDSLALEQGVWVFRLEPESGVVMTALKALEKSDWAPSETASSAMSEDEPGGAAP